MIKVTYIDHMGSDLRVVNAARISFANESPTLTERDEKLIRYLAKNDHMSPFEHCTLTVLIECPLYIRSQIQRHRTFSYNEVSRRYTEENLTFFVPEEFRAQSKSNKQCSAGPLDETGQKKARGLMSELLVRAYATYEQLVDLGVSREQARAVLPQAAMTSFYMTGNLRNWAHFLKLRLHEHAQAEAQEVAKQVEAIIAERWPVSYAALNEGK